MRGVFRTDAESSTRLPRSAIHTVLVCRRNIRTFGDSLILTALLSELAAVFPGAEVDIVCGDGPGPDSLVRSLPNVGHIHPTPPHPAGHLLATASAFRAVRRRHYDLAIDPDPGRRRGACS
jgi:ADP-heptose:LPS heptosyltransferase